MIFEESMISGYFKNEHKNLDKDVTINNQKIIAQSTNNLF